MPAISLALAAVGALNVPTDPTCDPIGGLGDVPGWLICQADAYSSLLVAAATVAAAAIAALAHRREQNRIEERTDAADARIAGLAYVVRRTLAKSLEEPWLEGGGRQRQRRAQELRSGLVDHEPRVEDMLAEAARASQNTAEDVRYFSRLFWRTADGVGDAADANLIVAAQSGRTGRVTAYELPDDALEGFRRAKALTADAVEILRRLDAPIRETER